MRSLFTVSLLFIAASLASPAWAERGWTWGVGHNNPPGSTLGLNFTHFWNNWAFEAGIGHVGTTEVSDTSDPDTEEVSSFSIGGDLGMKYLFGSQGIRPYLQTGIGTAIGVSEDGQFGAGAGINNPYLGAGFYFFGRGFHLYLSYLFVNAQGFQFGIGF